MELYNPFSHATYACRQRILVHFQMGLVVVIRSTQCSGRIIHLAYSIITFIRHILSIGAPSSQSSEAGFTSSYLCFEARSNMFIGVTLLCYVTLLPSRGVTAMAIDGSSQYLYSLLASAIFFSNPKMFRSLSTASLIRVFGVPLLLLRCGSTTIICLYIIEARVRRLCVTF